MTSDEAKAFAEADCVNEFERISKTLGLQPVAKPRTLFLAGSPGAGKSEFISRVLTKSEPVLVVDADEFRKKFDGYQGHNAHEFQKGAVVYVKYFYKTAIAKSFHVVMDSNFAALGVAKQNIDASLKAGRSVTIMFIYLSPLAAWQYVKKRESETGRNVPASVFVHNFLDAQLVFEELRQLYGDKVTFKAMIRIAKDATDVGYKIAYDSTKGLNEQIPETYSVSDLERIAV